MEGSGDFIKRLGKGLSTKVFLCLEDPADLARVTAVSKSWHHFVIKNGLFKKHCLKKCPELSTVVETNTTPETTAGFKSHKEFEVTEMQKNDQRVYANLARALNSSGIETCIIAAAVSASSTDNYPEEGIENTLEPRDRFRRTASYWSSKGQSDPTVPETLIYKLVSNICFISEIHLKPFEAFFQSGFPIYSAKAVRFSTGYLKSAVEGGRSTMPTNGQGFGDDMFVWTYTSPEFPMLQEARLQRFRLPRPTLCIGDIMKIELLGRVQKQEMDDLYYICIAHVQALGRALDLDIEIVDKQGRCDLKML